MRQFKNQQPEISLGKGLAWLMMERQSGCKADKFDLDNSTKEFLNELRGNLPEKDTGKRSTSAFIAVPQDACLTNRLYLPDHPEIFLSLLFENPTEQNCHTLTNHLNRCFHCFEYFCDVFRDYYNNYNLKIEENIGR